MDHMHIRFEYRPIAQKKVNSSKEKDLNNNLDAIQTQQRGINKLEAAIEESKDEYKEIQQASIIFALFLKHNSIVPYNDALVEYLDHHINQEKALVASGAAKEKLDNLQKMRAEHVEQIKILKETMDSGTDTEL